MEQELLDSLSKEQLTYLAVAAIASATAFGHILIRSFFNRISALNQQCDRNERSLERLKIWLAATLGEKPPD